MAAAVAGAALGAVGGVISSAITAGVDRANTKDTLANNLQLQDKRGQNALDVQDKVNAGGTIIKTIEGSNLRDVEKIRGTNNQATQGIVNKGMTDVASINTDTSKYLQQQAFAQSTYIRNNLQKSLEDAGLPSYLAFIQPDESLMQVRQVRGLNFATYYPGQRFKRAAY